MLACMSSKTLEEAVEANYEKESKTPPRSESKSNLRKTKSFTCQTLIHPSWSFKSQGNHSRDQSRDRSRDQSLSPHDEGSPHADGKEEVASGKLVGKGWKSFFAALQCSRAPLRSADVGSLSPSTIWWIVFYYLINTFRLNLSDAWHKKNSKVLLQVGLQVRHFWWPPVIDDFISRFSDIFCILFYFLVCSSQISCILSWLDFMCTFKR